MRHCYASYARGNRVCEWCYFVRGSSQRSRNSTSRALVLSPWCRLDHAYGMYSQASIAISQIVAAPVAAVLLQLSGVGGLAGCA